MIDYTLSKIEKAAVHYVGNKNNEEELYLSDSLLDISDEKIRELLFKFFIKPFFNPEYFSFTSENDDVKENPVYNFASQIFANPNVFMDNSVELTRHLYNLTLHPQIKSGDLFVVYFSELCVEDEITEAIGLFKSENKDSFLKLIRDDSSFIINYEDGINIEKLDKGCIIFNTDKEAGYKVSMIDKSGKGSEARFWKDDFLQLKPYTDVYYYTKNMMTVTKDYITSQLTDEFDVNRTDQIDLLNRSADYFKSHDNFNRGEYEKEVFRNPKMIKSFREYDEDYRSANDIEYDDIFEISPSAVKRQIRIFKGVLKLDKNFHIYIHGDKELIVPGIEPDGRKFYKVYFENES